MIILEEMFLWLIIQRIYYLMRVILHIIYIFIFILVIISFKDKYNSSCYIFNIFCIKKRVKSNIIKYSVITKNVIGDALNFHNNFIIKYYIKHHYYIALDNESFFIMKNYTSNLFINKLNISSYNNIDFGTENYGRVVISKTKINKFLLSLHKNILLLDIDIFFFKNPLNYILRYKEDLIITQDGKDNNKIVNTGL